MSVPLAFIHSLPAPPSGISLGDQLAELVTDAGRVETFLDCLPSTSQPALWYPDPQRPPLTHADLREFVSHFALPVSDPSKRLGPNDRVMIALPTGCENAVALIALATYHTCAPVNASCTAAELREDAERLGVRAVVTTRDAAERLELRELREHLGCEIIYVEHHLGGPVGLFDMVVDNADGSFGVTLPPSKPHGLYDQSLVLHTSGTSGKKKVVPYALRSIIIGTLAVVKSWDLRESDVNMNMMPLFHVGGIVRNLFAPMMSGGSAIIASGFDANAFWELATGLGATWYYAAPTMHHAILSAQPSDIVPSKDTRIRMICNAAGGLLPALAIQLKETFNGAVVLPSYGMTECMPIASPPTTYQLDRPGCSGIACGPYMSIRDPFNLERELPRGAYGAVCVRGLPTFDGYEKNRDAPLDTSAFSSEGWFDGGDMGTMDEDGYLFISGRSKEIINKGGEVISPFEIEEAVTNVAKHRVKNTLAFSVEHDVLQETIGLVIVPVPDHPRIGLAELLDLLRDTLHPSKWPFAIVYMEDLPKNNAGKPLRIKLAPRLGIGRLHDGVPALHRHFSASVPDKNSALTEPIPCQRVTVDLQLIERAVNEIIGVDEVAVRIQSDHLLEAFVSVDPESDLTASSIKMVLLASLPGYCIPEPLYVFKKPLAKAGGAVDFVSMEQEINSQNASAMSPNALLIRDIVADLLSKDAATIAGDSDFFLIGGNSLLLGRLAYQIRKDTGNSLKVSDLFTNSTINGIASLLVIDEPTSNTLEEDTEKYPESISEYDVPDLEYGGAEYKDRHRGQNHPISLIVQAIPSLFFYPLKAAWAWTMILYVLSLVVEVISNNYWERVGSLLAAIVAARLSSRIVSPIAAILFKWIVIGKYRPGRYRMWSAYHLRWWIVNQFLRSAGRGVFAMHPSLELLYFRLLGAKIGRNVKIHNSAKLSEFDLIHIGDDACIDRALIRGFCVERDGYMRLDFVTIGRRAVINTYTQISPGADIADDAVYGPHSSSHEPPLSASHAVSNRNLHPQPHTLLKILVGWPLIFVVTFLSYVPWFAILCVMILTTDLAVHGLHPVESVIEWFATPRRILWHVVARVVRVVLAPIIQMILGIALKRIMGMTTEHSVEHTTQWILLRRYINSSLLSQYTLKHAFDVFGTHYEATSMVFRAMGAKVGKRVYWPGSGVYCPDPELLEIGDDVVFGSRSELFTTDAEGTGKITVGAGAMIADRVVLLSYTSVGRKTVMGSGSLGARGGVYPDGSTWMGSENGEAVCFAKGKVEEDEDTITPFGRAFYKRQAEFFVFPYWLLVIINILVSSLSAAFWSVPAIAAAQIMILFRRHAPNLHLFYPHTYNIAILFGLISMIFVVILFIQTVVAMAWVIATKWIVIGRRRVGPCEWDKSSYCQRWQLHLTLSRVLSRGHGNGGVLASLAGSAYIVWYYRALGAVIGKNCSIWAGGKVGLMTEPDLMELGDNVALDDCSVVAHINSRGKFALNALKIGNGCALRAGSRLLSGASMCDYSMLMEHSLLTSGEIAEENTVYVGWPASPMDASPNH
ncbi:acetyl-CoA synthetase-like protein [Punctularia strigosozonata HHB-11173 SS5]|uniref:acetyl-CoA synthetase-like protein n=1 Tax=Punctularia strigosozonata (strain HHB-11173) TaxID=741275 RepID=UPI0004416FCA|nr:acetyl-CoA synthetase-like protein [Punctularia strigosozonata HHB-11173 SS5]EIN09770.1 acetyl-CoA synthetase-like protein [Punctularia strigosozonata HHB-11173 SS5]